MKNITYEVRYGNPEINIKIIKGLTYDRALRLYDRAKKFAEDSGITWAIALWDSDGWLTKSETINPTGIIG